MSLGPATAQDAAAGKDVFKKCAACHVATEARNRVGPHLVGIVGRKAGSVEGFRYSEAMAAKGAEGLIWDEANIAAYMKDPKGFVPKNKMAFPGLKKDEDITNLIAYLKAPN
ncbi:MAG: cytochrome c family protein [Rhizobiaceae bacterium]|nr:cytochrome c family protein [Rhizobiaceae bacterium]